MNQNRMRDTRVGLFVAAVLVLLAAMIASLSSQSGLFRDTYSIKASFGNVQGLVEGAPVRLYGTDVGLVSKIYFAPGFGGKPVNVILDVDKGVQTRIRANTTATIRSMGLLGDKYVELMHGAPPAPVIKEGGTVETSPPPDLYGVMEKADEILSNIVNISSSLDTFMAEFASDENRENFSRTFRSMRNIVTEVETGDGLLHGLIYEPSPGDAIDDFSKAISDVREILEEARAGKGGVGESLTALSRSIGDLEDITARLRSGPGMLHDAVYAKGDESLMGNLNSSAKNLNQILVKMNEGEGTFGAFLNDPTLYEDLKIITGGAKRSGLVRRVVRHTIRKYEKRKDSEPGPSP
jgi:phospholipid/cholesterol/gamma-HCH transport system substrate-binding protein